MTMDGVLALRMRDAYEQLRGELFCDETGLIYDSISSHERSERFEHLPLIEEIQASVPNPHGYATGMEDCMLNAGFAVEMCILRSECEKGAREESQAFAKSIVRGMMLCAEVHGSAGYVVRGVSPRDGISAYIESSRDQFTLFVYGLWRYFHSAFASDDEKNRICKVLSDAAGFVESRMSESFGFNLGRLDGAPAMHLKMLGVGAHEAMRLPMIFAAAYSVSGRSRFYELYEKYYVQGMADSLQFSERKGPWWHIELSQMQFSLSLCRMVEHRADRLQTIDELMTHVSNVAEHQAMGYDLPRLRDYEGPWAPLACAWRDAKTFSVQLFNERKVALNGGKLYLKGEESKDFKQAFDRIRAVGNMVVSVMLTPDYQPSDAFVSLFEECVVRPEYKGHTSGALVNILCAYYLMVARRALGEAGGQSNLLEV